MDVTNIAKLSTSMAETGIRHEVGVSMLKKAMDIEVASAAQLIQSLPPTQNLPAHLGNTINTKA
ncbi:YjfB family protein [Telluria beijingensis]|uniref:YjfB family protein n=1 Tax=Telluria beijingensis TaxID=3068633 RepID=UPI0027954CE3|nr:YjfB family protein [Massilia sp. REN29]